MAPRPNDPIRLSEDPAVISNSRIRDLTSEIFGRLTVINYVKVSNRVGTFWKCQCECGTYLITLSSSLTTGRATSCGCLKKEELVKRTTTHGLCGTKLYGVWQAMRERCLSKTNKNYSRYGGRGIKVCEEWLNSAESFVIWAQSNGYRRGLELDRRDNNKGYTPDNCRFVTHHVNALNRTLHKEGNITGYCGVTRVAKNKYRPTIGYNNKQHNLNIFTTAKEAAIARDNFIVSKGWPHKLNFPGLREG